MMSTLLSESIGKKLLAARTQQGLSLEDVAFKTRIPASRLGELENDDLSNFANLTYAKGFMKLYSRFLNVDIEDYLREFDTRELANLSGVEYVHHGGLSLHGGTMESYSAAAAPASGRRWLPVAVLTLFLGGVLGVLYKMGGDLAVSTEEADSKPPTASKAKITEPAPTAEPEANKQPLLAAAPLPEGVEVKPATVRPKIGPDDPPASPDSAAPPAARPVPEAPPASPDEVGGFRPRR
jgi:cytoskeletal protein RodZ